jgi:hypothetical protein
MTAESFRCRLAERIRINKTFGDLYANLIMEQEEILTMFDEEMKGEPTKTCDTCKHCSKYGKSENMGDFIFCNFTNSIQPIGFGCMKWTAKDKKVQPKALKSPQAIEVIDLDDKKVQPSPITEQMKFIDSWTKKCLSENGIDPKLPEQELKDKARALGICISIERDNELGGNTYTFHGPKSDVLFIGDVKTMMKDDHTVIFEYLTNKKVQP